MIHLQGRAVAYELIGEADGVPVLLCHGLADSRLLGLSLERAAEAMGLAVIAPDRPGIGRSDFRKLDRLTDWADDVGAILAATGARQAVALGISAGGAFACALAHALPERIRALVLLSPLGQPAWGTAGMAAGERFSLAVATRLPDFGGWFLARLADLARRAPDLFFRIATSEMPEVDRETLERPEEREAFVSGYLEAFRLGSAGVAQDLRLLTNPWGFDLREINAPTWVHHGDADTTVPAQHARLFAAAIPNAELRIHRGHGHFSLFDSAPREILGPAVELVASRPAGSIES